jgi:hypothetical protein
VRSGDTLDKILQSLKLDNVQLSRSSPHLQMFMMSEKFSPVVLLPWQPIPAKPCTNSPIMPHRN